MHSIVHNFRMKEHHHLALFVLLQVFTFSMNKAGALVDTDTDTDTAEREALLSFKSMVSDPRESLLGWNLSSPHCIWFGVSCTGNTTRVQSLRLRGLGLIGAISPQLSNLISLEILDLSYNTFHGPIPLAFSSLSLLRRLILNNTNSINGTIPVSLSLCSNLEEISLSVNQLTGNLPSELGRLSRLEILQVSVNNLTGTIPPTFGNLSSLTVLSLARNHFFGRIPDELGSLRNLTILEFSDNQFTDEIPISIYNTSSLVVFSVTLNKLIGMLPPDMGLALPNLRELYMAQNKFSGPIPSSLSNASSRIQVLELTSNHFHGSVPLLGNMNDLVQLRLSFNNLSSTTEQNLQFINSLVNCTNLEVLMLNSNQLAGELPSSIANLSTHLREFWVDTNFLSGSFPRGMENFRNLTVVSLHLNSFKSKVPNSIGTLHKLEQFSIQQNLFFGDIPDIFSNLTQLYQLTMGNNHFSGKIPKSIGYCHGLFILGIFRNMLNGNIPNEIFGIPCLSKLFLDENALTGSLPIEVGGLKHLEIMDVSDNQLSGIIPTTIGGCTSLRIFRIARNRLSGSIPNSIVQLPGLERLDLSSNNLSGPIPDDLKTLRVLQNLNLSFNQLEGQVPRGGVFMNLGWDSLQGNNKLCGDEQEVTGKLRVPTCTSTTQKKQNGSVSLKIIIPIASFVLLCVVSCFIWVLMSHKKKDKIDKGTCSSPSFKEWWPKISYSEIQSATNGFALKNLIGKGAFGSVYKGFIGSDEHSMNTDIEEGASTIVAIKVFDLKQNKASHSFNSECEALRHVRHRNLVKVITSCSSIDHGGAEFKALIMEFMSNGDLDRWLYPEDAESGPTLNLTQRLNVAIDVAEAVNYLHHDCDPPIVHRDLKPGNVLLDDNMVAHVGDFGLARFLSQNPSQNQSSTIGLKGSIGYIAPEYGFGGKVSTSGDVYSYGILLLEIFTTKKPTDEMFKDGEHLIKFASRVYENRVMEIIDPRIFNDNSYSKHSSITTGTSSSTNEWQSRTELCLAALVRVGLSCAADLAQDRLTMRETLTKMHEIKANLLEL